MYETNASRLNPSSKGFKMLDHLMHHSHLGGCTKYELLTEVLGKVGSKQKLRGYYSVYFQGWVKSGVVTLDHDTYKYNITPHGTLMFLNAKSR